MRTLTLNKSTQGVIIQLNSDSELVAVNYVKRLNQKVTIEVEDECNDTFFNEGMIVYDKYTKRPSCIGMKLLLGRLAKEGKL